MHKAYIALGSNLRNPEQQVLQAFEVIGSLPKTRVTQRSSLYRSAPVGYDSQPDFINAVAEIETELPPLELLRALLDIENSFGRKRPFPNAPRVLDLDLLLYNNVVMHTRELTLPHPRMHARAFVLLPLAEIAPDLMLLPRLASIGELAAKCDHQGVEKIQKNIP